MKLGNFRKVLVYLFYSLALALPLSFEYKLNDHLELTLFSEPIMGVITLLIPVYFFKKIGFKQLSILDKLVLLYLLATLLSAFFSVDIIASIKYFITICWITSSGYFLPRFAKLTRAEWKKSIVLFLISVSVLSLYVLYQHSQLGIFNQSSYMVARPFIYQGHTNLTAIIEPTLLIVLFLLYHGIPKKRPFLPYLLFITFIFIIDFSCSRASFVTTLVTLGAFFLLLPIRKKIGFALLVVGTVVGSYWIRYANDYYHENYVRQPLKVYDPKDRTTWKGTTTYSIPIDDDEVIKYREEHDGALVYEEVLDEVKPEKDSSIKNVEQVIEDKKPATLPSPAPKEITVEKPPKVVVEQTAPTPEPQKPEEKIVEQQQKPSSTPTPEPPVEEAPTLPTEVVVEGKSTSEIFALTTEERMNRAPISETNKELDILNFNDNHSNVERMNRWQAGIYFFKKFPFTGIGVGTFSDYYLSNYYEKGLVKQQTVVSSKKMNIHNLYLGWFTEGGIILGFSGLLILFYALKVQFSSLKLSIKGLITFYKKSIIIKGLILMYFASFLLHAIVQDFANEPRVAIIFWCVMAVLNLYQPAKRKSLKSTGKQG